MFCPSSPSSYRQLAGSKSFFNLAPPQAQQCWGPSVLSKGASLSTSAALAHGAERWHQTFPRHQGVPTKPTAATAPSARRAQAPSPARFTPAQHSRWGQLREHQAGAGSRHSVWRGREYPRHNCAAKGKERQSSDSVTATGSKHSERRLVHGERRSSAAKRCLVGSSAAWTRRE